MPQSLSILSMICRALEIAKLSPSTARSMTPASIFSRRSFCNDRIVSAVSSVFLEIFLRPR